MKKLNEMTTNEKKNLCEVISTMTVPSLTAEQCKYFIDNNMYDSMLKIVTPSGYFNNGERFSITGKKMNTLTAANTCLKNDGTFSVSGCIKRILKGYNDCSGEIKAYCDSININSYKELEKKLTVRNILVAMGAKEVSEFDLLLLDSKGNAVTKFSVYKVLCAMKKVK